jgi:GrpB-like predicted nucleotidyltransferase (UPF0157 family)
MAAVRIRPEAELRAAAQSAFESHRERVCELLPDAEGGVPRFEQLDADFRELRRLPGDGVPVGIQLTVAGSADDALFGPFREALIRAPALLAEYNALKLRLDGEDYERYTEVKGEFVERVLADRRDP